MAAYRFATVVAGVGLLVAACRGNESPDPPVHLQQNMDFQDKGEPQERNDFFGDHRVMRLPPPGTIAVGELREDDHLFRGLALDGTVADALPEGIALDEALLARGEGRFNIYCSPCHGTAGRADGPAARRGGGMAVDPVSLHMAKLQPAPLGYFFRVMTLGKGQMRSYAAQIPSESDRWAIAAWVRTLQISHRAGPGDIPSPAEADTQARNDERRAP